jgi:cyclic pyranopterin phosphate synthase
MASRRADLKTGYDCNCNCVFCVIGDQLFTGDRSTQECIAELRLSRETCEDVVFTGAEVTIRKDFFELVRAARGLGYRHIQVQTNGRMLAYLDFAKQAIAAGVTEFSPSIHGHTAKLHDGLVRAPGSFEQIVAAMKNLRALGARIVTNTVVTRQNARHLPALAELLVSIPVDQFQIAFPHPTGHAATYFDVVVPRMSEVEPFVHAALDVGIRAGIPSMAEAMPFCRMKGYERHVAELFIPPTEIVYEDFVVPDYARERMDRGKTRFAECATCRWEPVCEGPWREYPERMGSDEFQPVPGPRVVDARLVLDDRFSLLGTPARIDVSHTKARWVAVAFYPEAGSPSCTRELAGLDAGRADLDARGIEVVAIESPGAPRATWILDEARRIAHVLVDVDVDAPAKQIGDAIARLEAPPRPLGRKPDLVLIRTPEGRRPAIPEEIAHLAELE